MPFFPFLPSYFLGFTFPSFFLSFLTSFLLHYFSLSSSLLPPSFTLSLHFLLLITSYFFMNSSFHCFSFSFQLLSFFYTFSSFLPFSLLLPLFIFSLLLTSSLLLHHVFLSVSFPNLFNLFFLDSFCLLCFLIHPQKDASNQIPMHKTTLKKWYHMCWYDGNS